MKLNLDDIKKAFEESYKDFREKNTLSPENIKLIDDNIYTFLNNRNKALDSIIDESQYFRIDESNNNNNRILITEYKHVIKSHKDINYKMKLWITRNYVFYRIVDCVYFTFKDKLNDYSLNIFGSVTPESDIDIGIACNITSPEIKMSEIIKFFEDQFKLLNCTSLDLDIEMYADFNNLVDPTKLINVVEPIKLMPYIGAGILRNAVMGETEKLEHDKTEKLEHDKTEKLEHKEINNAYFTSFVQDYDFDLILNNDIVKVCLTDIDFDKFKNDRSWQDQAKNYYLEYHNKTNDARNAHYYKLVDDAQSYISNSETDIYTTINNLAMCNVYREESLISIFSVLHVVKLIQDKKIIGAITGLDECKTNNEITICYINKYGYFISLLEQVGYINRWHKVYCECSTNIDCPKEYIEKCKKKFDKYNFRAIDALLKLKSIKENDKINKTQNPIELNTLLLYDALKHTTSNNNYNWFTIGFFVLLIILLLLLLYILNPSFFYSSNNVDLRAENKPLI